MQTKLDPAHNSQHIPGARTRVNCDVTETVIVCLHIPALNGEIPEDPLSALTLDITLHRPSLLSEHVSPSMEKLKRTLCILCGPKRRRSTSRPSSHRGLWAATQRAALARLPRRVAGGRLALASCQLRFPRGMPRSAGQT